MTNGNFKELCPQTHFDTSNTWQPCSGAKVLYVRMVKAQGGSGVWNGPIKLQGCASSSYDQCLSSFGTHQHNTNSAGTTLSNDHCACPPPRP